MVFFQEREMGVPVMFLAEFTIDKSVVADT